MRRIVSSLRFAVPPVLAALSFFLFCDCKKKPEPTHSPTEVANSWRRAAAAGDAAKADACLSGGAAKKKNAAVFAEYTRVKKAAAAGDKLAAAMLKRLEELRIGKVRSGSVMTVVPLVYADGGTFLEITLELKGDRWMITDIR